MQVEADGVCLLTATDRFFELTLRVWVRACAGEGGVGAQRSVVSEQAAERLAEELCRLRGAGLKIGQMLSIQDENLMPPVRAAADDPSHSISTQELALHEPCEELSCA